MVYFTNNGTGIVQEMQNKVYEDILRIFISCMEDVQYYVTDRLTEWVNLTDEALKNVLSGEQNRYARHKTIGLGVTPFNKVYPIEIVSERMFKIDFRTELRITFKEDDNIENKINERAIKEAHRTIHSNVVSHGFYNKSVGIDDVRMAVERHNTKLFDIRGDYNYSIAAYYLFNKAEIE